MAPRTSIIAATGRNRELGRGNELLWHIPEDLERFKQLTLGHPVIMGRKTFDSIVAMLGKPLPGRTNIVVTRSSTLLGINDHDVILANSIEEALAKAKEIEQEEIFIGGGAQVYEAALTRADRLYLTLIEDAKEADAYFPAYEDLFTKKLSEEIREFEGLTYRWVDLEK